MNKTVHFPIDGHLGGVLFLLIINKTAMNILAQDYMHIHTHFFPLGNTVRGGIPGL